MVKSLRCSLLLNNGWRSRRSNGITSFIWYCDIDKPRALGCTLIINVYNPVKLNYINLIDNIIGNKFLCGCFGPSHNLA